MIAFRTEQRWVMPVPRFAAKKSEPLKPRWNPSDQTIQPDLFSPINPTQPGLKRFAVLGDAGNGLQGQFDIATRMQEAYQKTPFASVLVLGDNVYENGEPKYFQERIQKPYQPLMDEGVRFYAVMGNHDANRGYQARQMAYWGVPQHYAVRVGNLEFVGIDTTVFLPGYDRCHEKNPFLAQKQAEEQLKWLDKTLADSTAKYKIVFGHYPLYSSGMHATRTDITLKLRQMLEPILVRHGVSVYLAGHEHHYEKSQLLQGIQHFVSGAGGKLRKNVHYKDNPPYPREKLIPKLHFMLFEETDQGLRYDVISRKGKVLDSGLIRPNQAVTGIKFA